MPEDKNTISFIREIDGKETLNCLKCGWRGRLGCYMTMENKVMVNKYTVICTNDQCINKTPTTYYNNEIDALKHWNNEQLKNCPFCGCEKPFINTHMPGQPIYRIDIELHEKNCFLRNLYCFGTQQRLLTVLSKPWNRRARKKRNR